MMACIEEHGDGTRYIPSLVANKNFREGRSLLVQSWAIPWTEPANNVDLGGNHEEDDLGLVLAAQISRFGIDEPTRPQSNEVKMVMIIII